MQDQRDVKVGKMDENLTGNELIEMIKSCSAKPHKKKAPLETGSFADVLDASVFKTMERPLLVSSCYGVGSKLKAALSMNRFDTIGKDCVAVGVNDILCKGADPLFFSGHIACTKNKTDVTSQIINGMEAACAEAGMTFGGVRISELSNLYGPEELGVVGFSVGGADEAGIIDGTTIKPGNSILGIASSGLHASGYSDISNVFRNYNEGILNTYFENIGATLGDVLLEPVKIYRKAIQNIRDAGIRIRGIAHISGGSFQTNLSRILPEGTAAEISRSSFAHPEIFRMIEETGGFSVEKMYDTFNMGIGMAVVIASQDRENALQAVRHSGEIAFLIGTIREGEKEVLLTD